jgi:hypothetical protein
MRERIQRLRAERSDGEYVRAYTEARRAAVARVARASAGLVGALATVVLLGLLLLPALREVRSTQDAAAWSGIATAVSVLGWALWLVAAPIAKLTTDLLLARHPNPRLPEPLHPATELALLEDRGDPLRETRALASRWELAGATLPLVPLTIGLLPALRFGFAVARGTIRPSEPVGLAPWVVSILVAAVAHLVLLVVTLWLGGRARHEVDYEQPSRLPRCWGPIFAWAIVLGVIPVLIGLGMVAFSWAPPAIVD